MYVFIYIVHMQYFERKESQAPSESRWHISSVSTTPERCHTFACDLKEQGAKATHRYKDPYVLL